MQSQENHGNKSVTLNGKSNISYTRALRARGTQHGHGKVQQDRQATNNRFWMRLKWKKSAMESALCLVDKVIGLKAENLIIEICKLFFLLAVLKYT